MMEHANNVSLKSDYDRRTLKSYDDVVEEYLFKLDAAKKANAE